MTLIQSKAPRAARVAAAFGVIAAMAAASVAVAAPANAVAPYDKNVQPGQTVTMNVDFASAAPAEYLYAYSTLRFKVGGGATFAEQDVVPRLSYNATTKKYDVVTHLSGDSCVLSDGDTTLTCTFTRLPSQPLNYKILTGATGEKLWTPQVKIPAGAPLGATYPVTGTLTSTQNAKVYTSSAAVAMVEEGPVAISSPAEGATIPQKGAVIEGTGTAGTTVTLQDTKGAVLGSAPVSADGTYAITIDGRLPVGPLQVVVKTAKKTSAVRNLTVEVAPEPIVLTAPASGSVVTDTKRPVFSGTATPGADITVRGSSGRVVAQTTADAEGAWSVPAGFDLVNGSYYGTVSQSAHSEIARYDFKVNVKPAIVETTPVTLTSPSLDDILTPGKPAFTGKGHPGASLVVKGAFGTLLGTGTVEADGTWSIDSAVTLVPGSYSGTATQTVNGKSSTAAFRFTITKPEVKVTPVELTAPSMNAQLEAGKPVFEGTGHPGATIIVKGKYGTTLGTGTVDRDGNWSIESSVSLVAGSYSGTATQDVDGKRSSSPFAFTAK